MASNTESDEMAENFRQALQDLTGNTKHEINNLTFIARECTEHAQSISDVIVTHILKVAPHKKLASLYVLDSIVKNVGSPYNLFFSRNLYKIFMEAYAMVDQQTRRKMEEMLRTWREAVPGSIDRRPVFELETVAPIEAALMRFKGVTAAPAQPHAGQQPPPQPQQPQFGKQFSQNAFAPPVTTAQFVPQPSQHLHFSTQQNSSANSPAPVYAGSLPPAAFPVPFGAGVAQVAAPKPDEIDIGSLSNDIAYLVTVLKAEALLKPGDTRVQIKIGALEDLQRILRSELDLPIDQLRLVKNQVTELARTVGGIPTRPVAQAVSSLPSTAAVPYTTSSTFPNPLLSGVSNAALQQAYFGHYGRQTPPLSITPHNVVPPPVVNSPVAHSVGQRSAAPAKVSLASLFGPSATAALKQVHTQINSVKTQIPPLGGQALGLPPPPPSTTLHQTSKPSVDPMLLISMLRSRGIIAPASGRTTPMVGTSPTPVSALLCTAPIPVPPQPPRISAVGALFKKYWPKMHMALYDNRGPPCSQCGQRFSDDEPGKAKRLAHMDWHFMVHKRMAESQSGRHLNWYMSEQNWVRHEETTNMIHRSNGSGQSGTNSNGSGVSACKGTDSGLGTGLESADFNGGMGEQKPAPKDRWIRVPDDPVLKVSMCPVCQETFKMAWLDEAQEFVWMDATKVNGRIYHATCHAEAFGRADGNNNGRDGRTLVTVTPIAAAVTTARQGSQTPEGVLGKRKAEDDDDYNPAPSKLRLSAGALSE